MAEEFGPKIHRVEISRGKRLVQQVDVGPAWPQPALDGRTRRQPEVLGFSLGDLVAPRSRFAGNHSCFEFRVGLPALVWIGGIP